MNYGETLDYLFSQLPMYQRIGAAAYKANLDNTIALSNYLGNPEKKFKSIHIAGTNGKGSVAHMLASVLQEAGYKTGLATSPHLKDFRERIKINGQLISENEVADFVSRHKDFFEKLKPSFFEMAMAMTFDYFAREQVDIAVIETGLGGRLDSSNIITPEVSVITNIGLDHTHLLGDTIEKIAYEKAGIIKEGVPVVIGRKQDDIQHVFQDISGTKNARLVEAGKLFSLLNAEMARVDGVDYFHVELQSDRKRWSLLLDLAGKYQPENLVCAVAALQTLSEGGKFAIPDVAIHEGLKRVIKNTGLYGRWQQIGHRPAIICDTAHNADGMKHVIRQLMGMPFNDLHIVFGMVDDKERAAILELLPKQAKYYFCRPAVPRGLLASVLAEEAKHFGLHGDVYKDVNESLKQAKMNAAENDLIFVGGSTFIVAEAL